jgi:exodeoxyribonuclease V alpha subunit
VLGDLCVYAADGHYDAATAAWARDCTGAELPADKRQPADRGPAPPLAQQTVMLRESRRFTGAIGTLAGAVNAGQPDAALAVLRAGGSAEPGDQGTLRWLQPHHPGAVVDLALHGRADRHSHPAAHGGYLAYLALMRRGPSAGDATAWVRDVLRAYERCRLLCAVREGDWGVAGLNQAIEARLRQWGHIARSGEWYEGRPVIVTRNDAALGVFNGDVGVTLKAADGVPRVWFLDGDTPRGVLASRLAQVDTCYAMTVHKSQGSEFEHTVLVLPPRSNPVLTRELVYTGITRARRAFTLVAPDAGVLAGAIQRQVRRASGLPSLLG